jgi:hypothetical protein
VISLFFMGSMRSLSHRCIIYLATLSLLAYLFAWLLCCWSARVLFIEQHSFILLIYNVNVCRYMKLKYATISEAQATVEALKTFKEGITVKHYSKDDSESGYLVLWHWHACLYCSCSPASTIIGAIGGASPKPGNGEDCVRKGIRHKILASTLLFWLPIDNI